MGDLESETEILHIQLGKTVKAWSNLEFLLSALLGCLIGPPVPNKIPLFYSILGNRTRADLLRKALEASFLDDKTKDEVTTFIDRFEKYNRMRNRYIHGVYAFGSKDGAKSGRYKIIDFTKPKASHEELSLGNIRDLSKNEINNHAEEVYSLSKEITQYLIDRFEFDIAKKENYELPRQQPDQEKP